MTEEHKNTLPDWPVLLERIKHDLLSLSCLDRFWLKHRIAVIEDLQVALDDLFRRAGGLETCAVCDGSCCGCGRHHMTLTNLLAYLLADEEPPTPDFSCTCPYLGDRGCLLPVARRPYNCITFFCETLDDRLSVADREHLRTLDQQLRSEYLSIAERYPAASLRGLLIAVQQSGKSQLLRQAEQDVVE